MRTKSKYYNNLLSIVAAILSSVVYMINVGVIRLPLGLYTQLSTTAWLRTTPLNELLYNLQHHHPTLSHLLAVALILGGCAVMLFATIKHNLYGDVSYRPAIIYLALFAALSTPDNLLAPPLAALFMAISLRNLYDAYGKVNLTHKLFNGLFFIGMLPLIFNSAIVLLLLLFVVLILFERSGREIVVAFVAILTPILLQSYTLWLMGYGFGAQLDSFVTSLLYRHGTLHGYFGSLFLIILTIPVGIYASRNIDELSITLMSRKRIFYAVVASLWSMVMIFTPSFIPFQMLLIAPLVSVFSAAAISVMPQKWATYTYISALLIALLIRFIPL